MVNALPSGNCTLLAHESFDYPANAALHGCVTADSVSNLRPPGMTTTEIFTIKQLVDRFHLEGCLFQATMLPAVPTSCPQGGYQPMQVALLSTSIAPVVMPLVVLPNGAELGWG
ncbi:MAG: hypothetical protein R2795_24715 [Saprospiraceae bacterium]